MEKGTYLADIVIKSLNLKESANDTKEITPQSMIILRNRLKAELSTKESSLFHPREKACSRG